MPTDITHEFEALGHRYVVRLHDPEEGLPLAATLASMGVPALIDAAVAALPGLLDEGGALAEALGGDGGILDAPISTEALARQVLGAVAENSASVKDSAAQLLGDPRLPGLAKRALAYSTRDGEPCIVGGKLSPVYAGNYHELALAVFHALKANAGFGGPGSSLSAA